MQKKLLFFSLLLFGLSVPIFGMEKRPSQGADPYMWLDLLLSRSLTWKEVPPIFQQLLLDEAKKTPVFLGKCLDLGGEESVPFAQLRNEAGKKEVNRFLLRTFTPPPSVLGVFHKEQPRLDGIIQALANGLYTWGDVAYFQRGAVQRYARETKREGCVLKSLKDYQQHKQMDAIIQQLEDEVPWRTFLRRIEMLFEGMQ